MCVCFRRISTLCAGVVTALCFSGSAFAFEADDVAKRLTERLSTLGYKVTWDNVSKNGDSIVLDKVRATVSGVDEDADIGAVILQGVKEDGGTYTIDTVSLPDYTNENDGIKLSISGTSLTGLVLPPDGGEKTIRSAVPYSGFNVAGIVVSGPGGEMFNLARLNASLDIPDGGKMASFKTLIESFKINSTAFPDPEARAGFAALGFSTVEGSVDSYGTWTLEDGRMSIEKMALIVNDAGTLDINLDIGGYTMEFIESMQAIQKKMMEEGENENTGLAMLGLMQQITFHSASIRFEDNSLTNKVLEFVAAQQGMRPADIANQAKAVLPFALAQLNNPQFATEVTTAVSAYLDNPRNIEVSATPGTPLPVALLIAGGMSAPENLPNQLGVKVLANQ